MSQIVLTRAGFMPAQQISRTPRATGSPAYTTSHSIPLLAHRKTPSPRHYWAASQPDDTPGPLRFTSLPDFSPRVPAAHPVDPPKSRLLYKLLETRSQILERSSCVAQASFLVLRRGRLAVAHCTRGCKGVFSKTKTQTLARCCCVVIVRATGSLSLAPGSRPCVQQFY